MSQWGLARIALVVPLLAAALLAQITTGRAAAAIYWQNESAEIGRANLDGSNPDPEFIRIPALPKASNDTTVSCAGVAVDDTHIYWADNAHETIGRARLDGSEVEGAFITGASEPCGLAVDSSHVYWVNWEGETIGRANLDGSSVRQDFLDVGWRSCGVAVSDAHLFWSNLHGDVGRASLAGSGRVDPLVPGGNICALTTAGDRLYWTDWEGSIGSATSAGTEIDPELVEGLHNPCGVAVHRGEIYWAEQPYPNPGSIGRAALDGTHVERGIVTGLRLPCGMAVDDRPVPPKAIPVPRQVSLGPVRHNLRNGSILLGVTLSVPGELSIGRVPRAIHHRFLGTGGEGELSAGRHWLRLSVGHGPTSDWLRRALRRRGIAEFSIEVGYAPLGNPAEVVHRRLTMQRRPPCRASRGCTR